MSYIQWTEDLGVVAAGFDHNLWILVEMMNLHLGIGLSLNVTCLEVVLNIVGYSLVFHLVPNCKIVEIDTRAR